VPRPDDLASRMPFPDPQAVRERIEMMRQLKISALR